MILKNLRLTSFKNHLNAEIEFGSEINCVVGKNGVGKTNLVDAIYYLSFSKSSLGLADSLLITHGMPAFTVFGSYENLTLAIQSEIGKGKTIKINGSVPEKLSDLIGMVPLVMVLPDDTLMIKDGSEKRRKFFDGALCQVDKVYLESLLHYSKVLKQRNSLLKHDGKTVDMKLLETYDEVLIPLAQHISAKRNEMRETFFPYLEKNYSDLHDAEEIPGLAFHTQIDKTFPDQFRANIQKDLLMKRTLLGSHRDDYLFTLDNKHIKKFGSQGQQKTFIIALKLALFDFLKEKTQKTPLLLLDDIFDKLDDNRIDRLVSMLNDGSRFGQIFITDARSDRSEMLFKEVENVRFIKL